MLAATIALLFCLPAEMLHWRSGSEVVYAVPVPATSPERLLWDLSISGADVASGEILIPAGASAVRIRVDPDPVRGVLRGRLAYRFAPNGHEVNHEVLLYPPAPLADLDLDGRGIGIIGRGAAVNRLRAVKIPTKRVTIDSARLARPDTLLIADAASSRPSREAAIHKLAASGTVVIVMADPTADRLLGHALTDTNGPLQQRPHQLLTDVPVAATTDASHRVIADPGTSMQPLVTSNDQPLLAVEHVGRGCVVYCLLPLGEDDPRLDLLLRNALTWRPADAGRNSTGTRTELPEIRIPSGTKP